MSGLRAALALTALAVALGGCPSFFGQPLPDAPAGDYAELGDTHVHYEITAPAAGVRPRGTLVLVHGFGATLREWAGLVPVLSAAGWRTIAVDLRGHGWTSRPDGDYSLGGQATLVLDLLDRLGVERFSLIGHSWGSAVSLTIASRVPDRVGRVALYNGMFFGEQEPVIFAWSRVPVLGEVIYGAFYAERADEKLAFAFYDPKAWVSEALVEGAEALQARPGAAAAALATIRALDLDALEPVYPTIRQPVLLLWGREDQVTPVEWGERLSNLLPDARLMVFPRCGHIPMVEAARPSTRAVLEFLAVESDTTALASQEQPQRAAQATSDHEPSSGRDARNPFDPGLRASRPHRQPVHADSSDSKSEGSR